MFRLLPDCLCKNLQKQNSFTMTIMDEKSKNFWQIMAFKNTYVW